VATITKTQDNENSLDQVSQVEYKLLVKLWINGCKVKKTADFYLPEVGQCPVPSVL